MLDFEAGSQNSLPSIIREEIPTKRIQTMKPFNITTNGITKLLKNLNPYKAQGPDNLSPRILNLRLCFMYVQNFFIPECGSSSFGVTIF
jgi:hypothetical protein